MEKAVVLEPSYVGAVTRRLRCSPFFLPRLLLACFCQRRPALRSCVKQPPPCCYSRCCRRLRSRTRSKLKGAEEDSEGDADLEAGGHSPSPGARRSVVAPSDAIAECQEGATSPNGAAAAASADEVPSWKIPKLVVDGKGRGGARVPKGTSVILPEAGGDLLAAIVANLPLLLQFRPTWHLGYSLAVDGVSLRTLYRHLGQRGPCLLVVEDSSHCIFGAFFSDGLRPGNQCYGSHECFLFRFDRAAGSWRAEIFVHSLEAPEKSAGCVTANVARTVTAEADAEEDRTSGTASASSQLTAAGATHWTGYHEALQKCGAFVAAAAPRHSAAFCDHAGIIAGIDGPALFVDQNLLRGVSWSSSAFGSPCLHGNASDGPDFVVRNLEVWYWEGMT